MELFNYTGVSIIDRGGAAWPGAEDRAGLFILHPPPRGVFASGKQVEKISVRIPNPFEFN